MTSSMNTSAIFGNKLWGYPGTEVRILCYLSITFSHVFVLGGKTKKPLRFLDENIPEVCFGNICKVIPDLNNIFKALHTKPVSTSDGEGFLAVQNGQFNLPNPDTCSCHCSGADLTRGMRATLVKLKESDGLCQNDNY